MANAINEQARGDPFALAADIIAALEKAGYRITPGTEDTALSSLRRARRSLARHPAAASRLTAVHL
jgi:hypothetical protein